MSEPIFDPSQPFEVVEDEPKFDPTQPFEEVTPISSMEKTEQLPEVVRVGGSAAAAGLGTEALRRAVSGGGQALLENVGKLTPQQMNTISQRPEDYKKARKFEDLLKEFENLANKNRQAAFQFRREGVQSLEGLEPIKSSELIRNLGNIQNAPMAELAPDELPQPTFKKDNVSRLESLMNEKRQLESKLGQLLETGVESPQMSQEIATLQNNISDINKQTSSIARRAFSDMATPIEPSLSQYSQVTNIPEELLEARPDLKTKKIQPELGSVLQKEVEFLKTGSLEPKSIADYVRSLQDQASYQDIPSQTDKFRQEVARNQSEFLKSLPGAEDYARGQELSKKAIELEQGMKEFGLKLNAEGELKISNPKKIENLYKTGSPEEIARLERYIQEAQDLGYNPLSDIDKAKLSQIDRFQTELPLSDIRKVVETATDKPLVNTAKRIGAMSLGAAVGGVPGAIGGLGASSVLPTGTKVQEVASLAKGTKTYKTLAGASKFLGPVAAIGAGLLASGQSQAAGDPMALSAAKGVAETFSPPGLSGSEAISQGQAAAEQQITSMTPEELIQAPEMPSDIMGAQDVVMSNPIITETLKGAAKGLVSPIPDLAKMGASALDSFGTKRSADARQRMEKQMNASESFGESKFETTDGPAMTQFADYLENSQDKASQEYGRVMRQVISSPDREKQAVLFSLNQNPAFRKLAKEYKGQ